MGRDEIVALLDSVIERSNRAEARAEALAHALKDILDVAEREIMGFPIDREEWYARRDYARIQLAAVATESEEA